MNSFSSRLIPVAVASILCGVALAGKDGVPMDDQLQTMEQMLEKNGDGKITAAEYMQAEKELFDKIDTNEDGYITVQELEAYHQSPMSAHGHSGTGKSKPQAMSSVEQIRKMDTDDDGKVNATEWAAAAKQRFAQMDTDGDGTLTAQELRAGERAMMASGE